MRVSDGFRRFALEQLSAVPGLRARAMFGGVGVYSDDVFFGILAADVLFLKVDDTNRQEYETAGSVPFKPYADRAMTMPYYNVPVAVLEDAATLVAWAGRAVAVAKSAKPAPGRRSPRSARAGRPETAGARAAARVPATIDDYIAAAAPEVRAILRRIRQAVRRAAPDADEVISYRMPAFKQKGILIYFAAFKHHIGLFPPVRGDARLETAVSRYAGPKGNLQLPLDQPIPYRLIERIIKLRLRQNSAKGRTAGSKSSRSG